MKNIFKNTFLTFTYMYVYINIYIISMFKTYLKLFILYLYNFCKNK